MYISQIKVNKKAIKEFLPLQDGDVPDTYADVDDLISTFNYKPATEISYGIKNFVEWYREYHNIYER